MWWKLILQWRYPDSTLPLFCYLCLWAQGSWSAFAAFPQALAAISLQTAHVPPHTASLSSPGGMRSRQSLANCACTWLPVNFSQWSYSQLFITTSYPPLPHQCRTLLQCIHRSRDTEWRKKKKNSVIYHTCFLKLLNLITGTVLKNPTSLTVFIGIFADLRLQKCWVTFLHGCLN